MGKKESNFMRVLKNYRFSLLLLSGVVIGSILGIVLGEKAQVLQPFADVFLNMVFTLIVPVVFVFIANAIANMGDLQKLGKVLGVFFAVIVVGGIATAVLAFGAVGLFDPAKGVVLDLMENVDPGNTSLDFVRMITVSDFSELLTIRNMMALIIFAIFFGVSISSIGKKGEPIVTLLTALSNVLNKMVSIVMLYAPIGIACYFATLIGRLGGQIINSIARMSVIYSVFCILFFVSFGVIVPLISGGRDALKAYWREIWLPATTAAGACSSTACIPVNLMATNKMGVPDEISSLVIPLGASMHKNGVVSVQIIKIVFLFGIFQMTMGPADIVKAIVVALISGIIVGTIPSGGFIGEMFIVSAFGFPTSVIPIIVIMGTITDPFCTMNNVTSDPAMAMLITRIVNGKTWLKEKLELAMAQ